MTAEQQITVRATDVSAGGGQPAVVVRAAAVTADPVAGFLPGAGSLHAAGASSL
jgi:hypothetical protein